jgi:hypothetical protein
MTILIVAVFAILLVLFESKVNIKKRYSKFYDKFNLPIIDFICFLVACAFAFFVAYLLYEVNKTIALIAWFLLLIYAYYIFFPERNFFDKD